MKERLTFICECHSLEHQISFWYDEDDDILYCEPHLSTNRNFWQRLWYSVKYVFGYKCRYGAFDEMIFKKEDLDKLYNYLSKDVPSNNNTKV